MIICGFELECGPPLIEGFFAGFWGLDKAEKRGKSVSFPVRSLLAMMQTFWLQQNVVWPFLVSSVHYPIFNENAVVLTLYSAVQSPRSFL